MEPGDTLIYSDAPEVRFIDTPRLPDDVLKLHRDCSVCAQAPRSRPPRTFAEMIEFKLPKSAYNHMTAKGRARRS